MMSAQYGMPPPPPQPMMMRPGKRPREQDDSVIQVVANDTSMENMGYEDTDLLIFGYSWISYYYIIN